MENELPITPPRGFMYQLRQYSAVLISFLFLLFVALMIWQAWRMQDRLVKRSALDQASMYVNAVVQMRGLYSAEVAGPAFASGLSVTHDYHGVVGSIPLPATFTIMLSERISSNIDGLNIRIYSSYPFPWREIDGPVDQFEEEALAAVVANPTQPYYRFVNGENGRMVRYTVADVMQESCVACHNNHPDSPKQDWKIGDVRGAVSIELPIEAATADARIGFRDISAMAVTMSALIGLSVFLLVRRSRRTRTELEARVFERTAALTAANVKLEYGMQERELAEKRLTAVLDTVGEGIITIDTDGRIIMLNQEANAIWGYDTGELDGKQFQILVKGALFSGNQWLAGAGDRPSQVLGKRFEMSGIHRNGSEFPVEMRITRTLIDGQLFFTIAVRNISRRKQMENALKADRMTLAQRVKERTLELEQANAELERASQMKDEFLASMSHELRTPLNAILGLSEALLTETYGDLNARQHRPLHLINESGQHLLDLINDILDVSKIAAGRLKLDCGLVNGKDVCNASLSMVRQAATKKSIRLTGHFDPTIEQLFADERRLKQILVNLLSNAVKFTPENGAVSLHMRGDRARNLLHFAVIDTGIGIPQSDIKRLFEPFVQLDSRLSRAYNGTGLGLALVRRLTEMHGGSVSVSSQEGEGSRFVVTIPWTTDAKIQPIEINLSPFQVIAPPAPLPAPAAVAPVVAPPPSAEPLVLLAEDNEVNIATLYDFLEFRGFRIVVAHNGVEAVEQATLQSPDIVLMDIQMPQMDGLEAIRRIRQMPALVELPIIALTGLAMSGDRERCLRAGANDYLSKPFQLDELVERMERLLDRERMPT